MNRISMNPLRASMAAPKFASIPMSRGLGGAHFSNPEFIQQGHNTSKHPGFAALVKKGVPAGALANAARHASPAAKKANPRLKRVK